MRRASTRTVVAMLAVAAVLAPVAAGRAPSRAERAALTALQPASVRAAPLACLWLDVEVDAGGRFARVRPTVVDPARAACVRFASDGVAVYRRTGASWRQVYAGSDLPACSLGIPRRLLGCRS